MKNNVIMVFALTAVLSLTACGSSGAAASAKAPAGSKAEEAPVQEQKEAGQEAKEEVKEEAAEAKPAESAPVESAPAEAPAESTAEAAEEPAVESTEAAAEEPEIELVPIEAFSYSTELGEHEITVELITLDEPVYQTSVSSVGTAYRDGKGYVAANDLITIYDISGNTGTLSQTIDYEYAKDLDVGTDGTMFVNGGVFGAVPVTADGTIGEKIDVSGEIDISLDGSFGMTFFSGNLTGKKAAVDGTSVEESGEIEFPELSKIHCISACDNEIVVGGKLVDGDSVGIAVYDADGSFKYQVNNVPNQNNYVDVCVTESGVIGVTPGLIGFGQEDGTVYEIKVSEFLDDTIWPVSVTEAEDGSVIIAGSVYRTTGEIVFLRLTGF